MAEKKFFKGAILIDGTGCSPIENGGLLIEGDQIIAVGSVNDIVVEDDVEVVDLSGKTIMPGMINAHVHVTLEPVGDPLSHHDQNSHTRRVLTGINNLKKHLQSGFTYIRDIGAKNYVDIELRDCINEGILEGPGMVVSGHILTMTGGQAWKLARECDGVDEVRKAAREQLKAGADFIKVMATGGILSPGNMPTSCQQTVEEMRAAVEVAHNAGKKAASHCQGAQGTVNALLAGVDSIEHGAFLTDEAIDLMVKNGTYLVPTLVATHFIESTGVEGGVPEFAVKKAKMVKPNQLESFMKAYKAGVKFAIGSDAGTSFNYHDKAAIEMQIMKECGVKPMDILVAATMGGADLLGIQDEYGSLETGKKADFIVLGANPLEDIDTLLNVEQVFKLGRKVK